MTTHSSPTSVRPPSLDPADARAWIASWDAQQATFFTDREERFAVVVDVLETVLGRPDPLVVDLGCGPGSLAARIHDRLPGAAVVGADMDPLLLGLARAAHGDWLTLHHLDLRDPGWVERLGLDRDPDAVVSSTALHWIDRGPLRSVLSAAAAALAPGGVIIDADHIRDVDLPDVEDEIGRRSVGRSGPHDEAHDWPGWWAAAESAPELADLVAERGRVDLDHAVTDEAHLADYLDAMRHGGCHRAGTVWQVGSDRVVVGIKRA